MAWQLGPVAILPTAGHWTTRSRVAIFWTRKPIKRTLIFAKLSCNTQHRMRHYNTSFKLHFRPAKSRIFCMLIKCTTHWLPVPSPPTNHIFSENCTAILIPNSISKPRPLSITNKDVSATLAECPVMYLYNIQCTMYYIDNWSEWVIIDLLQKKLIRKTFKMWHFHPHCMSDLKLGQIRHNRWQSYGW